MLNAAPVAVADSYTVLHGQSLAASAYSEPLGVLHNDTDADATDTLSVTKVNGSAANVQQWVPLTGGNLWMGSDGSFTFVALLDFVGQQSFTYETSDGQASSSATVTIDVTNQAPNATDDAYQVLHGQSLAASPYSEPFGVLHNDTDADAADSLSVTKVNGSAANVQQWVPLTGGNLWMGSDGSFTFVALLDFVGQQSFTYETSDGQASSSATVTIDVTNQAPNALADIETYEVAHGEQLNVSPYSEPYGVLHNDTDEDAADWLTVSAVNGSAANVQAWVALAGGDLWMGADGGFAFVANGAPGLLTFSYDATDGADYATAAVTINITNAAPVLPVDSDNSLNVIDEGAADGAGVGIMAYATDTVAVTYALTNDAGGRFQIDPVTGGVTVADGSLIDFESSGGSYTIAVAASDGYMASAPVVFTIAVNNVAPAAPADDDPAADTIHEGAATSTAVGVTAKALDPAGGPVSYALTDDAGGRFQIDSSTGVVTVANGTLIDYESSGGSYTISVEATDGALHSAAANFTITVTNVAPAAPTDDNNVVNEVDEGADTGTEVGITVKALDPAGGSVTYSLTDDAGGRFQIDSSTGVVSVADGSLIDFEASGGSYAITAQVSDGDLASTQNFTIPVSNVAPQATGKQMSLLHGRSKTGNLLTGATDPNGATLTVSVVNQPANGSVTYNAATGEFTYTAPLFFEGADNFTFKVSDGTNESEPATVEINVVRTVVWDNGGDGVNWHDADNWNVDVLPGENDDVVIGEGYEVVLDSSVPAIRSLRSDGNLDVYGDLTILGNSTASGYFRLFGILNLTEAINFQLLGGGEISGLVHTAVNAVVEALSGEIVAQPGAEVTGPGTLRIAGNNVFTANGTSRATNVELAAGGTVAGAGEFIVTNTLLWTGGMMQGTGTTRITGTATVAPAGNITLRNRRLENEGTFNWDGATNNGLWIFSGAVGDEASFVNTGRFNIRTAQDRSFRIANGVLVVPPVVGSMTNSGEMVQTGNGSAFIWLREITHAGSLDVEGGDLNLRVAEGMLSTGHMEAAAETRIIFEGGPFVFDPNANDVGSNMMRGAGWFVNNGTVELPSSVAVEADNFLMEDEVSHLVGEGLFSAKLFHWYGGEMSDAGVTEITPGHRMVINGTGACLAPLLPSA